MVIPLTLQGRGWWQARRVRPRQRRTSTVRPAPGTVAVHICCIHPPSLREHGHVVHPVLTHGRTLLLPWCMKSG